MQTVHEPFYFQKWKFPLILTHLNESMGINIATVALTRREYRMNTIDNQIYVHYDVSDNVLSPV